MPQVTLHHGNFEVQMQISSEAPTDVFGLADQLVEFARVLVGKVTEARLADRLREELGPCGKAGNCFEEDCGVECPRCGSEAAYRKGTRPRTVEVPRLGTVEVERPYLECRQCGRSYAPYSAGAPERRRYGQEALRRPIEATMETSYRRGAEAYPESPSAHTLWRIVNGAHRRPLRRRDRLTQMQRRSRPLRGRVSPMQRAFPPARKTPSTASRLPTQSSPTGQESTEPEGPVVVQP